MADATVTTPPITRSATEPNNVTVHSPESFPEISVDGVELTGWTVIDTDGSLVVAPSEKEGACGTYQGTWGHHVFVATCDNTGEELVAVLHEGNVTANDASVNIKVIQRAVAQLPWWRRQKLLIRVGCPRALPTSGLTRPWRSLPVCEVIVSRLQPAKVLVALDSAATRCHGCRGQRVLQAEAPRSGGAGPDSVQG